MARGYEPLLIDMMTPSGTITHSEDPGILIGRSPKLLIERGDDMVSNPESGIFGG